MIFDLDGTLVQTEKLKALSYARAAVELCPQHLDEADVIEAFKTVVGLSRREVALGLMRRFGLEGAAQQRVQELGGGTAWQAFVQLRLGYYEKLLADPQTLRDNRWTHNVTLLHQARQAGYKVGLATMSYCPQVQRVLDVLDLSGAFGFVASRDDVERGKPDPEIYLMVAAELCVLPRCCLVIEDSPVGVAAALAAGMAVVAVTTPFTRQQFQQHDVLDRRWVVDDPNTLAAVVEQRVAAR